jgi:hypothetical protein
MRAQIKLLEAQMESVNDRANKMRDACNKYLKEENDLRFELLKA